MTIQIAEKIIYEGRSSPLYSELLNSLLMKKRSGAKEFKFSSPSTGCWRGYIGTWELEEGKLYLKDLTV